MKIQQKTLICLNVYFGIFFWKRIWVCRVCFVLEMIVLIVFMRLSVIFYIYEKNEGASVDLFETIEHLKTKINN